MQMKQKIEKPDNAKGCVAVTVRAHVRDNFGVGRGHGGRGGGRGGRPCNFKSWGRQKHPALRIHALVQYVFVAEEVGHVLRAVFLHPRAVVGRKTAARGRRKDDVDSMSPKARESPKN